MEKQEKEYQAVITSLEKLTEVRISDQFRSHVSNILIPSLPIPYRPSFISTLFRPAILVSILFLLSGTSLVFAAERSNPGDILYPVKKAVESIQVATAQNNAAKALLHISHADKRVEEMKNKINNGDTSDLSALSNEYETSINNALEELQKLDEHKTSTVEKINEQLERNAQNLEEIKAHVPNTNQEAVQKAVDVSNKGQEEIKKDLSGTPIPTIQTMPKENNNDQNKDHHNVSAEEKTNPNPSKDNANDKNDKSNLNLKGGD